MNFSRVHIAALVLVSLVTAAPLVAQPPAKDRIPDRTLSPESTELFRGLLDFHNLRPLPVNQFDSKPPGNVVIVILGLTASYPGGRDVAEMTRAVLRGGGSVLLATDSLAPLMRFFPQPTDLDVTGERVLAPGDGASRFRDRPDCPFVVPALSLLDLGNLGLDVGQTGEEETLFLGRRNIATNRPSALRLGRQRSPYIRKVLAGFPKGCVNGSSGAPLSEDRVFAVGGSGRTGEMPFRSLVLADSSVFSNQMLMAQDESGGPATQNLVFANDVVRFLRGPDGSAKTHCLFIENREVKTRFDEVKFATSSLPPVPPLPIPSFTNPEFQRKLTDLANEQIAVQQEKDRVNRELTGSDRRFTTTIRALAIALGILVILYFLSRVWRVRHEPDRPPVPTDTGRIAGSAPPGSIARRLEEVLQSGNYTPLVQEYLRDLFAERGLDRADDPAPRPLPAIAVSGPEARTLKAHLRILWDVAYGAKPRPVTYSRWKELEPMIEALRRAADENRWRFIPVGVRA